MADLEKMQRELDEYRKKGYNVLFPSTQLFELSPLQELHYETLQLVPSKHPGGDAYYLPGNKCGISAQGYQRIAIAAGIIWDPLQTRQIPTGDPARISFQATGAMQKPDGSWIAHAASYELNLSVKRKQIRRRLETSVDDMGQPKYSPGEINERLEDEMLREEAFAPQKAETGAKARVVRAITGMKSIYSEEDLRKPFIVPKVSLNTNYLLSNKSTRAMILEQAIHSSMNIFGPGQRQISAPGHYDQIVDVTSVAKEDEETDGSTTDANVIDESTHEEPLSTQRPTEKAVTLPVFKTKQEVLDFFGPMPPAEQWNILEAKLKHDNKVWAIPESFLSLPAERQTTAILYYFEPPKPVNKGPF